MAQTYEQLVSGTTTFGTLYTKINNMLEALRSAFSGTSFPTTPSPGEGQFCYRTDEDKLYIYRNTAWEEVPLSGTLWQEIINARGTKSTLDQRMDVALNEDGTLKAATTLNPSQWYLPSLTFAYASTTSFTVNGDQTDIYKATRRLKVNLAASVAYTEVLSAVYTTLTTITVLDAVLDATLVDVEHSLFLPRKDSGAMSLEMLSGAGNLTVQGRINTASAAVAGTVNAITAVHSPAFTAWVDKMRGTFRAAGANTTTTPTFAPDGLAAKTFVKEALIALQAGDIAGAGHEVEWIYNSTADKVILLNPSVGLPFPKFSAHKNAVNQTGVVTATWTKVTFTTEEYDVGSAYDAANSKWIPGRVGNGHIDASIYWDSLPASTQCQLSIYKNGVTYKASVPYGIIADAITHAINFDVLVGVVTDYFEIYAMQSGGADKIISGGITRTIFSGHMLP